MWIYTRVTIVTKEIGWFRCRRRGRQVLQKLHSICSTWKTYHGVILLRGTNLSSTKRCSTNLFQTVCFPSVLFHGTNLLCRGTDPPCRNSSRYLFVFYFVPWSKIFHGTNRSFRNQPISCVWLGWSRKWAWKEESCKLSSARDCLLKVMTEDGSSGNIARPAAVSSDRRLYQERTDCWSVANCWLVVAWAMLLRWLHIPWW